MNLILHQFKTDARHFRWWLAAIWISFAGQAVLMGEGAFTMDETIVLQILLVLWQMGACVMIVVALVQADAMAGDTAGWLGRPLRRQHLFWAKSAFILLLLVLPRTGALGVAWAVRGYSFHLWLCAAAESFMVGAAFTLAAAALSSFSRSMPRFFLMAGILVGVFLAWAAALSMLRHVGLLHAPSSAWKGTPSFDASVEAVCFLLVATSALASWIAQGALRRTAGGMVCLAVGVFGLPLAAMQWNLDFLTPKLRPVEGVSAVVLTQNDLRHKSPEIQHLSSDLGASGVPARDVAVTQHLDVSLRFDGGKTPPLLAPAPNFRQEGHRPKWPGQSPQSQNYLRLIEKDFPSNTYWFSDDYIFWRGGNGRAFAGAEEQYNESRPPGTLKGSVELDLFAVKKVAEVPLKPAKFNTFPGQSVTIRKVVVVDGVVTIFAAECSADLLWDRDMQTSGVIGTEEPWREPVCTYVLYHPGSDEAFIVEAQNSEGLFPASMLGTTYLLFQLHVPFSPLRERLTGMTATEWINEARLCVYAPIYDGTTRQSFFAEHYQWRPSPTPVK
jgi:hypothetical protein